LGKLFWESFRWSRIVMWRLEHVAYCHLFAFWNVTSLPPLHMGCLWRLASNECGYIGKL
jgi:hypothetical protein